MTEEALELIRQRWISHREHSQKISNEIMHLESVLEKSRKWEHKAFVDYMEARREYEERK